MSKKVGLIAGRPSATKNAATLSSLSDEVAGKRVTFELPSDRHTKLKIYAAKQGKSIKEILTEYINNLTDN